MTVTGSTLSGNTFAGDPRGVYTLRNVALLGEATLTIRNSTVSGNGGMPPAATARAGRAGCSPGPATFATPTRCSAR